MIMCSSLYQLLQFKLNIITQLHLIPKPSGIEDDLLPTRLFLPLSSQFLLICLLVLLISFEVLIILLLFIVLRGLEFDIDVDDIISEN